MDVVVLQLCGHQWPDGGDHWWASTRASNKPRDSSKSRVLFSLVKGT